MSRAVTTSSASAALVEGQLPMAEVLAALKPVLEDPSILKIGQNVKYDWKLLARHGIRMAPVDDTMLMSYALNAGTHNHGMDELAERYLGHKCIPIKDLIGSGKSQIHFGQVAIDKAAPYAAEDADVTLRLYRHFAPHAAGRAGDHRLRHAGSADDPGPGGRWR